MLGNYEKKDTSVSMKKNDSLAIIEFINIIITNAKSPVAQSLRLNEESNAFAHKKHKLLRRGLYPVMTDQPIRFY